MPNNRDPKTYLEQRENLLGEVVVKVWVLGPAHVVDEDQTGTLRLRVLKRTVQLIDDALQRGLVRNAERTVAAGGEQGDGSATGRASGLKANANTNYYEDWAGQASTDSPES